MADIPEPWRGFLADLDARLETETCLHCFGGFVVTVLHGAPRSTGDLDVLSIVPSTDQCRLQEFAGEGSPLHARHGIYLDVVKIATYPENYNDRLNEVFAGEFRKIRLFALDPHDLVLVKLSRNIDRDRSDVQHYCW